MQGMERARNCGLAVLAALAALLVTAAKAQTRDLRKLYPKMAPLGDYLMNRQAEITLARSAAPAPISHDATVLVLTRQGWETAAQGTNGFVCMVERGWAVSIDFTEMWNPEMRGADCLNAAAARTIVPVVRKLTAMALAGDSDAQRAAGIRAAFAKGEIPRLEAGAMGYMMAKGSYLTDQDGHNGPHLMMFVPERSGAAWGAGAANSPVVASVSYWFPNDDRNPLNKTLPPMRVFAVVVANWSDGTPAGNRQE
jgi:hypothetical protein